MKATGSSPVCSTKRKEPQNRSFVEETRVCGSFAICTSAVIPVPSVCLLRKIVAEQAQFDIIKTPETKEVADVHLIGNIDRNIYQCITDDIVTDEVIITDERIAHIKERHPNDYERFCSYIPGIIAQPDYIIKANMPDTAIVLKEIIDQGEKFQLVLRLKTTQGKPEYKNSVITFFNISERTWNKYLRNKEILYRRE